MSRTVSVTMSFQIRGERQNHYTRRAMRRLFWEPLLLLAGLAHFFH